MNHVPGQIISATSHDRFYPPNGGGLVREMGPRKFQGNRVVGEILFHLASSPCQGRLSLVGNLIVLNRSCEHCQFVGLVTVGDGYGPLAGLRAFNLF